MPTPVNRSPVSLPDRIGRRPMAFRKPPKYVPVQIPQTIIAPKASGRTHLLEVLDWMPGVSTVANLVHIVARSVLKIDPHSFYGQYLQGTQRATFTLPRTWRTHVANLCPVMNIFIQVWRLIDCYRRTPNT